MGGTMSTTNRSGRVACVEYTCPPYSECGGCLCDPVRKFRDLFYEANHDTFFPPLRFEYDRASNTFYVSINIKPYHPHVVVGVGHWEEFIDKDGDSGKRYVFIPDEELFPMLRELASELLGEVKYTVTWMTPARLVVF